MMFKSAVLRQAASSSFRRVSVPRLAFSRPSIRFLSSTPILSEYAPSSPRGRSNQNQNNTPKTNVFVGNLPWSMQEQDLHALFTQFGEVKNVKIAKDFDTGRSRGFAFVEFEELDDAKRMMEEQEKEQFESGGRTLFVGYATNEAGAGRRPQQDTRRRRDEEW